MTPQATNKTHSDSVVTEQLIKDMLFPRTEITLTYEESHHCKTEVGCHFQLVEDLFPVEASNVSATQDCTDSP